uniref:Tospovirus resistance protein B n=2 Tax=Solanum tuberosum TaxID=4113 RepID=M1AV53_SOLTU
MSCTMNIKFLKDLQRRTINLAYEAEVAIDSILAQYNAFLHSFCSLPTILKEIMQINAEVTEMWSTDIPLNPHYVAAPFKHLPAQHSNPVTDEEVVGFENKAEELIDYLIRGTNELDVVPIVGMGGQGKTTIARKLYNNDIIVSHFDVRAWCIISQTYSRRELLQEIFSQVMGSKDKEDAVGELADRLRKSLMGKRYLIVLDDMWDCMAWDDLRLSFPDVGMRSRIVVTTRQWKKVFQKEDCPPELQYVSQAVAEKCKGLPLVVVLVAGIIKKRKMEESWWNEVKYALFDYLDSECEEYSLATMQLSFDNLPDCLKPCLLYMGMFSEDARIPASKLISLWIAEGFVENTESGRLMEEEAEGYLMDLISSNVVIVSKKGYNGKVKCCQVHDVVHHFCLEKSREEKFMLAMEKSRHVEIREAEFDKQGFFEGSSKLENLRILKKIVGFPIDRLDVLSRSCPNLQQLHIKFEDDEEPFCPKLENLTQLQELQLSFVHPRILSGLQLPSNLKQVDVCFPQSEEWCLGDITFHKLKLLKLVQLGISRWDASEESFPLLETLVIKMCGDLEEIPLSFAYIPTLKQIKLIGSWKESLEDSAVRMKGEIEEIEGCDRIHLVKEQSDCYLSTRQHLVAAGKLNSWSLRKMAQINDIDDVLYHLRRIKSQGDQSSIKIDQIEKLEMELRMFRTFIKYYHILLHDFFVKPTKIAKLIVKMLHRVFDGIPYECKTNLDQERLVAQLLNFIDEGNSSLRYNYEFMNDSYLSDYMDCLGKNLNDVLIMCLKLDRSDPSWTNEKILHYNRFIKQLKIVQKKMRFLRYLYATEINGYIDHEKLECLETRIQFMANNVGQFCHAFSINVSEFEDDTDEDEDEDDKDEQEYMNKPPYLLCLIELVENSHCTSSVYEPPASVPSPFLPAELP